MASAFNATRVLRYPRITRGVRVLDAEHGKTLTNNAPSSRTSRLAKLLDHVSEAAYGDAPKAPPPPPLPLPGEMLASSSKVLTDATSSATRTVEEVGTEAEQAAREAEFYFSDINLPYDKYMWELYTANPMHAVPLLTLLSQPRLQRFAHYGTRWLADALKNSDALEVGKTSAFVRRRTEVAEAKELATDFKQRTVYVSGFGLHRKEMKDELRTFFESKYSGIIGYKSRQERLGRHKAAAVFLEFASTDAAKRFLGAPDLTWDDRQLVARTLEEYLDSQVWSQRLTRRDAEKYAEYMAGRTRSPPFNAFAHMDTEFKREGAAPADEEEPQTRVYVQFFGRRIRVHDEDRGVVRPEDVPVVRDATLQFSGVVQGHIDRRELLRLLAQRSPDLLPWVQYTRGDASGHLFFEKPLSDEDLAFVRTSLGTLSGQPVAWARLDEEDERRVQLDAIAAMARRARYVAGKRVRELGDEVYVWSHLQEARRVLEEPRAAGVGESDVRRTSFSVDAHERREPRMVDRLQRQYGLSASSSRRR